MTKQNTYRRVITFIGSSKFFWGVVALLVLQAAWIALSGRYPMAFDEDFHMGIIRLYADHISPFWTSQPPGSEAYGAVMRDPSYLYHYLMSFPYRLISLFTASETVQVLILRFLNIGFFAGGLVIFRRLLLKTGASRAVIHGCLLIFVLIPVVPLLAAQVNYDNVFIPLVALCLLLAVRVDGGLKAGRLPAGTVLQLLILCLCMSLIKYAFLPIFLAIAAFLTVRFALTIKNKKLTGDRQKMGWRSGIILVAGLLVVGGLFVERYGVNAVRYHTPVPDCSQVLSVQKCSAYGPWIRDHILATSKPADVPANPVVYMDYWLHGMWLRLFFAVDGPASNFQTKGPLIVPGMGAAVFAVAGFVLVLRYGKRIVRSYNSSVWLLLITVTATYVAILWFDGFQAYLRTGEPVAINGRYLLPVLLPLLLLTALAFKELFRSRPQITLWVAGAAITCLLWGGGALTYVLRSESTWYWTDSPFKQANAAVQKVLGPVTPGYANSTKFLR